MGRCPPGLYCMNSITFIILGLIFMIIIYVIYMNSFTNTNNNNNNNNTEKIVIKEKNNMNFPYFTPSYPYTNLGNDVLLNPYSAPLSDDRYIIPQINRVPNGTIPINVSTNIGAVDTNYRQMGILTAMNSKGKIMPLMGRPLFTNRDKWQYYTMSDQYNSVKLPVVKNGRSCTNEYGCDRIYDGDSVYIEGINETYKSTIYDSDTIKYLPFI